MIDHPSKVAGVDNPAGEPPLPGGKELFVFPSHVIIVRHITHHKLHDATTTDPGRLTTI